MVISGCCYVDLSYLRGAAKAASRRRGTCLLIMGQTLLTLSQSRQIDASSVGSGLIIIPSMTVHHQLKAFIYISRISAQIRDHKMLWNFRLSVSLSAILPPLVL